MIETKNLKDSIQLATIADRPALVNLLDFLHLPTADLSPTIDNFLIAKQHETVIGSCGLEIYGSCALLRSLAVATDHQGQGLGQLLSHAALDLAKEKGVQEIYLITNTAAAYFATKGFTVVERAQVPNTIKSTTQFSSVCPSTATVMFQRIK